MRNEGLRLTRNSALRDIQVPSAQYQNVQCKYVYIYTGVCHMYENTATVINKVLLQYLVHYNTSPAYGIATGPTRVLLR